MIRRRGRVGRRYLVPAQPRCLSPARLVNLSNHRSPGHPLYISHHPSPITHHPTQIFHKLLGKNLFLFHTTNILGWASVVSGYFPSKPTQPYCHFLCFTYLQHNRWLIMRQVWAKTSRVYLNAGKVCLNAGRVCVHLSRVCANPNHVCANLSRVYVHLSRVCVHLN
jgi:hypothetical protein